VSESLHLLVIDDNPDDRLLAARALKAEFPAAVLVEIATEAELLAILERGGFHAVVTDYQLKWSDGLAVLTAIKDRYPEVPVVMFTNTGNEEVCAAAMRRGLHDYLIKRPGQYARLPAAIRTGLEIVAARRALREKEAQLVEVNRWLQATNARLEEALERAEQADRLKDEFLATLSHELRTPLNSILGWAQVLARGGSKPETVAQGLKVIERNARAQARLIEDLLDVSKIMTGKLRLDVQRLELVPLVDAAMEAIAPAATRARAR
jgi:signal transduction histidine kinase